MADKNKDNRRYDMGGFQSHDGGGHDGGGYGGSGDSDNARDPNCRFCKNNERCPYIVWSDITGGYIHDSSGSATYSEKIITDNSFPTVEKTPRPGDKDKKKKGFFNW
jgi:hypothetical protein